MAQILRPNSADEVVKLNKMCERFPTVTRENVLNILNLCNFDEEKTKQMLMTFQDMENHPNYPIQRQVSSPPTSGPYPARVDQLPPLPHRPGNPSMTVQLPVETLHLLLNLRPKDRFDGTVDSYQPRHPFAPAPPTPIRYAHQMSYFHQYPRQYSQFYPPPPPPPPAPIMRDFSKVIEAQQEQLSSIKMEVRKVKEQIASLNAKREVYETTISELALAALQGIQDDDLEDKRVFIKTLEIDISSLNKKKVELLDLIRNIEPAIANDRDGGGNSFDSPKTSVWRCKVCGFDNEQGSPLCGMCRYKRGAPAQNH